MGGKNKRGAHADTKTVMNKDYIDTVRLLLEAAPAVFHGSTFAMKGGTAINLFACAMPRCTVVTCDCVGGWCVVVVGWSWQCFMRSVVCTVVYPQRFCVAFVRDTPMTHGPEVTLRSVV